MTRFVALLRGVNVGGRNRLPMADWRALLTARGLTGVTTYIQSGNAVFDSDAPPDALHCQITDDINARFGFAPGCCLLTATALDRALAANPFPQALEAPKTLHLVFLRGQAALDRDAALATCTNDEAFQMGDGVFYLHSPNGFGRSKLAERLERVLTADLLTARNLSTCLTLQKMART